MIVEDGSKWVHQPRVSQPIQGLYAHPLLVGYPVGGTLG